MASLRRTTTGNYFQFRTRDEEGRERQRSVTIGDAEDLQGGVAHWEAAIESITAEIAATPAWQRWEVSRLERLRERAAERLVAVLRAMEELGEVPAGEDS